MHRVKSALLLVVASSMFGSLHAQDASANRPTLVFRGGAVFDSVKGLRRPVAQLWVRGSRILGERKAGTAIPKSARVVDATGCTLLPGMFDLHTHVGVPGGSMSAMVQVAPSENLHTHAFCGVTHVVDLHGDEKMVFELRTESRKNTNMARLYCAGGAFTRPKGHATQFGVPANTVDSVDDVAKRFATLLPKRPNVIKAIVEHGEWGGLPKFPTLDEALFTAVKKQTEAAGIPLFAHIWSRNEALLATQHGASALAHGVFLGVVDDVLVKAMTQHGTAYFPTLSVVLATVRTVKKLQPYNHALVGEALHPDLFNSIAKDADASVLGMSPMARLGLRQEKVYFANLKKLSDAGIVIGTGTDAGNPLVPHGPGLLFELQLYVDAGLTPAETLQAATINSAKILRVDTDFGSLTKGKVADVVVVEGDPCADIAAIWKIREVYRDGVAVDRAAIKKRNLKRNSPARVMKIAGNESLRVIDDFEDGDANSNWGGTWKVTTDGVAGGKSKCKVTVQKGEQNCWLHIDGKLTADFKWGPWAGATIEWKQGARLVADVTGFTGIRLRVRGTARTFTVTAHRKAVKDFNFFVARFKATDDWSEVEIPFTSFKQIGFGKPLSWSATDIKGLQIDARNAVTGGPLGVFTLDIDSVRVY